MAAPPSPLCGEAAAAAAPPLCAHCGMDAFDFEDVHEGTRMICTACGALADDQDDLVAGPAFDAAGRTGVFVSADDDGARTGAALLQDGSRAGQAAALPSGGARVVAANLDRLAAGVSVLQLPAHVAAAARGLLPLVVDANAAAAPRRNTTAATVAATIYLAAREERYALTLGAAGAPLSVYGAEVGREFRRLVSALARPVPPPHLSTLVLRAAALVLPAYTPGVAGPLRTQPVVRAALDLADLLQRIEATDGRSPNVAAAAILSMCLAEQYKDARPSGYAAEVARLLGHDRSAVQAHIRTYTAQLAPLLALLPFADGDGDGAGGVLARRGEARMASAGLGEACAAAAVAAECALLQAWGSTEHPGVLALLEADAGTPPAGSSGSGRAAAQLAGGTAVAEQQHQQATTTISSWPGPAPQPEQQQPALQPCEPPPPPPPPPPPGALQQPPGHSPGAGQLGGARLPPLNLARVKVGSSAAVRNLGADEAAAPPPEVAERDAELCFERATFQLHPHAPLTDSRCYIYRPVGRKELEGVHALLQRLPECEGREVAGLWEALLAARRDCEMMAARGVRVSRDISRDWQETVSDLIDRVVTQDGELAQLRSQLKAAQAAAPAAPGAPGVEELLAHVARLRRQRDRLSREQQELGRALAAGQDAAQMAALEAAAAREECVALRQQHADLLRQHMELVAYAQGLQAAATAAAAPWGAATPDGAAPDQLDSGAAARTGGGQQKSPPVWGSGAGTAPAGGCAAQAAVRPPAAAPLSRAGLAALCPGGGSGAAAAPQPRGSDDTPDTRTPSSHAASLGTYDQQPPPLPALQGQLGERAKTPPRLAPGPVVPCGGGGCDSPQPRDLCGTLEAARLMLEAAAQI
ncbi:BRF1 [Scenedesmus sp. PABB004]|nr:BRF1 [Scenedesmus sp. PABB004]